MKDSEDQGKFSPTMFGGISNLTACVRSFYTSTVRLAANAKADKIKLSKVQMKKAETRKIVKSRISARKPVRNSPLYMPIQKALRFLRAAEVGQPENQQTISLTTLVIAEKGAPFLSGNIKFPTPLRNIKIAVFTNDESQATIAREKFKCNVVGGSDLIEKIKNDKVKINFDKAFATPDIITELSSSLGKILNSRGLLPSLKKGTVSSDISRLLEENMSSVPFRQRGNSIGIAVGKCTLSDKQIIENIIVAQKAFRIALSQQKTKKQNFLAKTTLTSTHGPGILIDFS